ncbi:MAG: hypothetical protein GF355_14465 [Candidatus Eisenbacteria bacterium]|nr:hypothetical protein [Candidatus Eisenbacteria bacterium]
MAILVLLLPFGAGAQLVGTNLFEGQSGNVPFREPENRYGFYEQLNLEYLSPGHVRAGLRYEADHNSEEAYTYNQITLRYAEWSDEILRIRAGNFYTILGRGLVHRSFDLTGVILDQPGLRSRYAPSRDVDGVLAEGSYGHLSGRFFWGEPNSGEFSPGTEDLGLERYVGQIAGGELSASPFRNARVGATYLRSTATGESQSEFGSGFLEIDPAGLLDVPGLFLPIYIEYAHRNATFSEWWDLETSDDRPHALYASSNLIWRNLALSAEWKDYSQFRLGTNDPPSLVREHSYVLLNRNTHVLNATLEQGFQLEGVYTWPAWGSITVNLSRSDGKTAKPVRFEEQYLEIHVDPIRSDLWEATAFYDLGKDEFIAVSDRDIYGASATIRLSDAISITGDLQRQHATRAMSTFTDNYLALATSLAGRGTLSLVWEHTDDPLEEDPETSGEPPVEPRDFVAGLLDVRLSDQHEVTLFYGERRGGSACTAGTCYEVLPFKGAEVRVTSRF